MPYNLSMDHETPRNSCCNVVHTPKLNLSRWDQHTDVSHSKRYISVIKLQFDPCSCQQETWQVLLTGWAAVTHSWHVKQPLPEEIWIVSASQHQRGSHRSLDIVEPCRGTTTVTTLYKHGIGIYSWPLCGRKLIFGDSKLYRVTGINQERFYQRKTRI